MELRRRILATILVVTSIACAPRQDEDQRFEALAKNYIEQFLRLNPEYATSLGDHRYDHLLNDYTLAGVERDLRFNRAYLDSLATVDVRRLSSTNEIDYKMLRHEVESSVFQLDTLQEYRWNPLVYNIGGAIYGLVARDFAPLKERLLSVKQRLAGVPAVIRAAKANLENPPRIHTETAILQNKGTISLIRDELETFLEQVPELTKELAPVQDSTVAALEEYGSWLDKELLPNSNGDPRIGDEKYRKKLRYTLDSDLSKEEVLQRANADLTETQHTMYETALLLYKKYFPSVSDQKTLRDNKAVIKAVLDKLAEAHPTNKTIVDLAKRDLETSTEFVRSDSLVTVPEEPVKIIIMPEFARGVAVAYCDSPGPLEKNGETFYAISPTPSDWSKERVNSFFREYNNYMLQDLTIHEAMPGHYLQLAHSNKFKAPTMVRAIFGSGTFIEGWATYAEQLMAEHGYGGPEVEMQS